MPATSSALPSSSARPTPYYAVPLSKPAGYSPISSINPVSSARDSSVNIIAPIPPATSAKYSRVNPLLPAVTPPSTVAASRETRLPFQTAEAASPAAMTAPVLLPKKEMNTVASEKKIISPTSSPEKISQSSVSALSSAPPYAPPWVARTIPHNESADKPSASTLPWKQPFGTETNSAESTEKKVPAKKLPAPDEDDPSMTLSHEISGEELEHPSASETRVPVVPEVSQHDEAAEEEISEEEALEKLPFEDVEGLSASDLDYLSKKEKEHRQAQAEEDGDLGIPSELKNTLNRQSSQLEGVLQANNLAPNDEKQEILRRLKKMMEEERH